MDYFPNHGNGLHRLVYTSRSTLAAKDADRVIGDIIAEAAAHNGAHAITGVLLATHGYFIQVLEGSHMMLKPLFDRIAADSRHRDVNLKLVEAATSRFFSGWSMRRVSPPDDQSGPMDLESASGADLIQLLRFVAHMAETKRPKGA